MSTDQGQSLVAPGHPPALHQAAEDALLQAVYGSTCKEADDTEWGGAGASPHIQGRNASLFDGGVIVLRSPIHKKKRRRKKKVEMHNVLLVAWGLAMCTGMNTAGCEGLIFRASYVQRRASMSS